MKIKKRELLKIIKEQQSNPNPTNVKVPSPLMLTLKKSTGLGNINQLGYLAQFLEQIANIMKVSPFNTSKYIRLKNLINKNFPLSDRDKENLDGTSIFGDLN